MRAKPAIPRLPTRHQRVGGARPGLLGADASSWVARGWVNEYGDEYEDIDEDDDLDVRRRGGPRVGRTGVPPRRGARPPPPGIPERNRRANALRRPTRLGATTTTTTKVLRS